MNIIFLYPIFFGLIFFWGNKKKYRVYYLIILMYFLAGLSSVYLVMNVDNFSRLKLDAYAISYHLIMLILLLYPLKSYDRFSLRELETPTTVVDKFTYFIIAIIIIYIIDGCGDVSFNAIIQDVHGLREDVTKSFYQSSSFIGYIAYIAKNFSAVPLALMYYYIIKRPNSHILIIVLFICSLGTAFVELRVAAREYIMKFLFVAVCMYLICYRQISKKWRQKIIGYGSVVAIIVLIVFLLITFLRFEDSKYTNTIQSLLSYFGQGYAYFSEAFLEYPNGMFEEKGTLCFPFFSGGGHSVFNLDEQVYSTITLNVFRTSIGSWLQDCGWALTVFVTCCFSILFYFIGRIRRFNAFSLIYIAWVYEFSFSLLFFFNSTITGTKILSIIVVVWLDLLNSSYRRKSIVTN